VEEELESEDDSSDEDDAEPLLAVRSYSALMQSLTADSAPQAKRRKLEHPQESTKVKKVPDSDSEDLNDQAGNADVVEEEEEEGPETATDGLLEDEDDDSEDASDPFEAHFANPEENILSKRLKALQLNQWTTQKTVLPKVGKAVTSLPQTDDAKIGAVPATVSGPGDLKLKQKLAGVISKQRPNFDPLEKSMATYMFNYQDILYCERSPVNSESLRRLACLHAVNHVFK
jgi:U3 small nucleolar RNA-associated protein 25